MCRAGRRAAAGAADGPVLQANGLVGAALAALVVSACCMEVLHVTVKQQEDMHVPVRNSNRRDSAVKKNSITHQTSSLAKQQLPFLRPSACRAVTASACACVLQEPVSKDACFANLLDQGQQAGVMLNKVSPAQQLLTACKAQAMAESPYAPALSPAGHACSAPPLLH